MRNTVYNRLWLFTAATASIVLGISCGDKGTDTPINNAPRITSLSSVEAVIDSMFTYTATASDFDGDNVSIGFGYTPSWMNVSGAVISGTPNAQTPDTSFMITASDGFLADTAIVSVTVVSAPAPVSYSNDIQPIFNDNCAGSQCHVGGAANGLTLDTYQTLMAGGNSGAVVLPGNPDGSIIVRRLEGNIQPQMPLGRQPLPQATIDLLRDWIAQGAHDN